MKTLALSIFLSALVVAGSLFVVLDKPQAVHAAPISSIQFPVPAISGAGYVCATWHLATNRSQTFWLYVDYNSQGGSFDRVGLTISVFNNNGVYQVAPCIEFLPPLGNIDSLFTLTLDLNTGQIWLITTQSHFDNLDCAVEGTVSDGAP